MLNEFRTLRVAVLCSRRAPGLEAVLRHPLRGKLFELACVLSTEVSFEGREAAHAAGIQVLHHPIRRFFGERRAPLRDLGTRREFDAVTAGVLRDLKVDTVVLLGYLFVLTEPMLQAFGGRMVNLHDSDLTLRTADGAPRYAGLHATHDAIVAGECETRSSVHFVTETIDAGPVLLLSERYTVAPFVRDAVSTGAAEVVKAYAYAHREWMMRDGWGPLAVRALEYISAGVEDELTFRGTIAPAEMAAVGS